MATRAPTTLSNFPRTTLAVVPSSGPQPATCCKARSRKTARLISRHQLTHLIYLRSEVSGGMAPLLVRYVKWWESKASCSGDISRANGSGGVIMSLARVSSMTSAILVFSCAWIAGMPAACSAFVVPLSSPSMSRCACRSAQVGFKIYAAGNTPFSCSCFFSNH